MTLMTLWQYSLRQYCLLQLNDKQQHSIISRDSIKHFFLDFCIKSYSNKWYCLWVDANIEFTRKKKNKIGINDEESTSCQFEIMGVHLALWYISSDSAISYFRYFICILIKWVLTISLHAWCVYIHFYKKRKRNEMKATLSLTKTHT